MTRFLSCSLLCALLILSATVGLCGTFDERLWETYAEIDISQIRDASGLAGLHLEPRQIGDVGAGIPFADLRVVTDQKEEVPFQIVSQRPERREEELAHRLQNLSRTGNGETWLELVLDGRAAAASAVEVMTPDTDFSRQVQVLGSPDGKNWNTLRKDGVIFDVSRTEKLRHTRISFPQTGFRYLALKIADNGAQPLAISDVRVLQEGQSSGQTYTISAMIDQPEINASRQESSIVIRMKRVFPLDRLKLATAERNFQRRVEVQIKGRTGEWERWTTGTIFSIDSPTMHESQLVIDMPEVAAREFRLQFRNLDSPPLPVSTVNGEGFRRLLIFKQPDDRKLFLFWGNPLAQPPSYDLAGVIAKQELGRLPIARLGQARPNGKFAGNDARLPFTERYRHLLYFVVTLAIAGLVFLQYRVLRRVGQ